MLVRTRRAPKGFSSHLPFGPDNWDVVRNAPAASEIAMAESINDLNLNVEIGKAVAVLENQLSAISGHDTLEAQRNAGRCRGPRLYWKSAIPISDGTMRSTPLSITWTITTRWLRALMELLEVEEKFLGGGIIEKLRRCRGISSLVR